jgi:hypothetical protein
MIKSDMIRDSAFYMTIYDAIYGAVDRLAVAESVCKGVVYVTVCGAVSNVINREVHASVAETVVEARHD